MLTVEKAKSFQVRNEILKGIHNKLKAKDELRFFF